MIEQIVELAFTVYALTFLITSSSLLSAFRRYVIAKSPILQPTGHSHFIECRMCVGFWMSLLVCAQVDELQWLFVIYGMSYFFATQER